MAARMQLWEVLDNFSAFFGGYRNFLAVLGMNSFPKSELNTFVFTFSFISLLIRVCLGFQDLTRFLPLFARWFEGLLSCQNASREGLILQVQCKMGW
jgi:hypothetical protein